MVKKIREHKCVAELVREAWKLRVGNRSPEEVRKRRIDVHYEHLCPPGILYIRICIASCTFVAAHLRTL